ncbi:MAG: DUF2341 domain-containing protein [Candidatus Thermoplasmatota archaeon]|nr:DUF2341 domain-containing protein [Candidatus Thermoplasmatota archaeon]MBU1941973.1 DUF2341 domain-containing protein [Candidatus Thermoplasmatota archaeon]
MGYSLIATTCVFMLTLAISFEFTHNQLSSSVLDTHESLTNMYSRSINKLNTDLQITNVSTNWWDTQWEYRKLITINSSLVTDDLTNFTILIETTDTNLRDYAKTNGQDIAFINYNGTEKYNHEIEEYDNSNGYLASWVKIPSLISSEDTLIYMYYGNTNASDQQNPFQAWDENYIAIWHFNNNSLADSTTNDYDGTNTGTTYVSNSKIAGGRLYDGDEYIDILNFYNLSTQMTAEVWVFQDNSNTQNFIRIFTLGPDWNINDWCLYWRIPDRQMRFVINSADFQSGGFFNKRNEWFHIAVSFDTGDVILYNNGSIDADWSGLYGNTILDTYDNLTLGNQNNGGRPWDGQLDEIRISSTSRDSNWIQTSFNCMQYPASFTQFSTQQSLTSNEIDLTITIVNTGITPLKTDELSILFNGKICSITCPDVFLSPNTEAICTVTGIITGTDRIKIISAEGISDYYIYQN